MSITSKAKTKKARDYELIALAYHEAGHAIVAIFNLMKVFSVKISNDKKISGITEWDYFWNYEIRSISDESLLNMLVYNDIEIAYSGFIAEKIYYKDICGSSRFPRTLKYGSESDISSASDLIKKYNLAPPGKPRQLLKKQIENNITSLLTENWDAVKMVAHAIYKKKKLNFDDLKNILTRKTNNKLLWKEKYKQIEILHEHRDVHESELKIILSK